MQAAAADYRTEILTIIQAFVSAADAKDAAAIAVLYADQATLLPPGQPAIKGRQNIQGFCKGFLAAGASDLKLTPVDVRGAGPYVYEIGEFSAMMPQPNGGTAPGSGKYVVVYERQSDGKLKMLVDIFNSNA